MSSVIHPHPLNSPQPGLGDLLGEAVACREQPRTIVPAPLSNARPASPYMPGEIIAEAVQGRLQIRRNSGSGDGGNVQDEVATGATQISKKARVRSYLRSLKIGDKVKATFRFKTDFGAFMWVNDIAHGLLFWSEMPGDRPERDEYLNKLRPGADLLAQIVSVDLKKRRVGLSMIAVERQRVFAGLVRGSIVQGTVGNIITKGAYVKFGNISGFLHVQELLGERPERDAALAAMKMGDKLELVVIEANEEANRLYLSQRRVAVAKLTPGQERVTEPLSK